MRRRPCCCCAVLIHTDVQVAGAFAFALVLLLLAVAGSTATSVVAPGRARDCEQLQNVGKGTATSNKDVTVDKDSVINNIELACDGSFLSAGVEGSSLQRRRVVVLLFYYIGSLT